MEHKAASFEVPELEKILAKKKKRYVGYEEGMEDNADAFAKASRKSVPTTIDGYIAAGSGSNRQTAQQGQQGGFTQNVNIYSPRELSPSETARQTRNATRQMVLKLKPT